MTVSITWSGSASGAAITSLDHGSEYNGGATTEENLYISHDGTNAITSVGFYIQAYTGSYTGGATAAEDYSELLSTDWGTADKGFQIAQDAGLVSFTSFKAGSGDASGTPIALLVTVPGVSIAGEIQNGEEGHIKTQVDIPALEDTAGVRQFDLVLKFTYTS